MNRRSFLLSGAAMAAATGLPSVAFGQAPAQVNPEGRPFSFETLIEEARALAQLPPRPPVTPALGGLSDLNFDRFRAIRFRPSRAMWRSDSLPFHAHFFHMGFLFKESVAMYEVVNGRATPIPYNAELFDLGGIDPTTVPPGIGFAGFRLHAPMNRPDYHDEVVSFLGASYFRAVGRDQQYGKSARGLAIDTALPRGEEFPRFSAFWLHRPEPGQTAAVVHALLESASCTGAYQFTIVPGRTTLTEVQARVFPRKNIERLGMAPLTSMYLFGENDRQGVDDFRPEVHDSDGLQIHTGAGEWLWRPLVNPERRVRVSSFFDGQPKGFGLIQRDRDFRRYEDLEARYHQRPSVWVEPLSGFGAGAVQLVEIPADSETVDNIVAYWVPNAPVERGADLAFSYRLHWMMDDARFQPMTARVSQTMVGLAGIAGMPVPPPSHRKFVLDFEGGLLGNLPGDAPVEAVLTTSAGRIGPVVTQKNGTSGGWRTFFDINTDGAETVEMRCFLRLRETALSETWSYQWTR